MNVRFNEEVMCAILQHSRDISERQGKYIDVKLEPDRIQELPEARQWPALGDFLVGINKTNLFRTTGCNADNTMVEGGHAAPFVDIAFDDPRLRLSDVASSRLRARILALNGHSAAEGFAIEMVESEARFPSGEVVLATRLWLLGDKAKAEEAFPLIVSALDAERLPEYLQQAADDLQPRHGDQLFAPIEIALDLISLGADIDGTYVCQSGDGYRTWSIELGAVFIEIALSEPPTPPQWDVLVIAGDKRAHYQGPELALPLYRGEAQVHKVLGEAGWPDSLTLRIV